MNGASEAINDFPPSDEPVYILGQKYSSLHGLFVLDLIQFDTFVCNGLNLFYRIARNS